MPKPSGSTLSPLALAVGGAAAFFAGRAVWRRLNAWDLHGRVALVTGGSRGLGLEIARELAAHGAKLALCARDAHELQRAQAELEGRGAEVLAVTCDLTHPDEVQPFVQAVLDRWGRIDVLINNAGVIQTGPMDDMTVADYQEAMNIHFWAPLGMVNAVLPEMRRRREGRVVNIASIGGKVSVPHLLPYDASKFALVGLSEGLHAELAKDGIAVTTVCPWLMRTGSPRHALFKGQHRLEYAWFSISDSLPVLSMSSTTAARRIVAALRRGDAELILSPQGRLAAAVHGLFPGLTAELLGLVNRVLPGPGGVGTRSMTGAESQSALSPSWLTRLGDRAAVRNNEIWSNGPPDRT
jgi:short-subunit dehydrogenase